MARNRLAKLLEVKKVNNEEATLAELRDMTDETFKVVLKYAGEAKSEEVTAKVDNETAQEKSAEQTEAALNDVKEEDTADFNVAEDTTKSETDQWLSMADVLCGHEEKKDKGGE